MNDMHQTALQDLQLCHCHLCMYKKEPTRVDLHSDVGTDNSLAEFIKMLPVGFPLILEQTVIFHHRDGVLEYHSYLNPPEERKKYSVVHQTLRGLSSLPCQNVQLYFQKTERIMTRFQASALLASGKAEDALYLQPYQHHPAIRVEFPACTQQLDNILRQHLAKQAEKSRHQGYKYNQQFFEWVYREYGEETFFYFLTDLSAKIFQAVTRGEIKRAVFFWIAERSAKDMLTVQKKGGEREKYNAMQQLGRPQRLHFRPKLVNVREFQVHKTQKLYSFQEQYHSLIKQRIASSSKRAIGSVKNKAYRARLQNFRGKIQQVYKLQQKKIMQGIEEEKQFQYQVDSQKMARLLIPSLPADQNLRQVLNDQQAFRQVFLPRRKDRNLTTFPNLNRTIAAQRSLRKDHKQHHQTRIKRRYEKLLTTPSTHQ